MCAQNQRPSYETNQDSIPLIRCQDISKEYQRSDRGTLFQRVTGTGEEVSVTALSSVSFTIDGGTVVGIAGPSGSGKSTLLHLLGGLVTPTEGEIEVAGTAVSDLSKSERIQFRFETIGFVFQRFHLLPSLSARANVALPLIQAGVSRSQRRERAMDLLERVGVADRASHTPGHLSGGEQQRVAIARALITDPSVILADEPTGELDTATSEQILELLSDLTGDMAVVIASHDEVALAATDRTMGLRDGQIINETQ